MPNPYAWAYPLIPFPFRRKRGGIVEAEYMDIWPVGRERAQAQGRYDAETGLVRGIPY